LCSLLYEMGQFEEIEGLLTRSEKATEPSELLMKARAQMRLGKFQKARETLTEREWTREKDSWPHFLLGLCFLDAGETSKALGEFRLASAKDNPKFAAFRLSQVLAQTE